MGSYPQLAPQGSGHAGPALHAPRGHHSQLPCQVAVLQVTCILSHRAPSEKRGPCLQVQAIKGGT